MRQSLVQVFAIAFSGMAGTANFVVAFAIFPFWRSLDAQAFVNWFGTYAKGFGIVAAPLTILAIAFTVWSLVRSWSDASRTWWLIASVCIIASMAVFPLYFLHTNSAFIAQSIPLDEVPAEMSRWFSWHWSRVATPIIAMLCGLIGFSSQEAGNDP